MRHQRLAVEMVEAVLAVREIEREPISHVGEQGGGGGGRGRRSGSPAGTRRRGGPDPRPGSVLLRQCERGVDRCWRRSGQITVSESICSADPNPKCRRGSTEDWNPRVGYCSSICIMPPVPPLPPCFTMTFAPIPAVLAPDPFRTTCK